MGATTPRGGLQLRLLPRVLAHRVETALSPKTAIFPSSGLQKYIAIVAALPARDRTPGHNVPMFPGLYDTNDIPRWLRTLRVSAALASPKPVAQRRYVDPPHVGVPSSLQQEVLPCTASSPVPILHTQMCATQVAGTGVGSNIDCLLV